VRSAEVESGIEKAAPAKGGFPDTITVETSSTFCECDPGKIKGALVMRLFFFGGVSVGVIDHFFDFIHHVLSFLDAAIQLFAHHIGGGVFTFHAGMLFSSGGGVIGLHSLFRLYSRITGIIRSLLAAACRQRASAKH
jgi:hypothetical protein